LDISTVPVGRAKHVVIEQYSYDGIQGRKDSDSWVRIPSEFRALSRSVFIIMPEGRPFKSFELIQFPKGKPGLAKIIRPYVIYHTEGNTRLGFSQMGGQEGYEEIFRWQW